MINEIEVGATLFLAVNSVLWMKTAPSICSHNTMVTISSTTYTIYVDICVYTLLEVWTGCVYIDMCSHCLWCTSKIVLSTARKGCRRLPKRNASITCSLWFPWKRGRPTVLNCTSVGMGACKVISSRDGRWYTVRVYFSCSWWGVQGKVWETSRPADGTRKTPTKRE